VRAHDADVLARCGLLCRGGKLGRAEKYVRIFAVVATLAQVTTM